MKMTTKCLLISLLLTPFLMMGCKCSHQESPDQGIVPMEEPPPITDELNEPMDNMEGVEDMMDGEGHDMHDESEHEH